MTQEFMRDFPEHFEGAVPARVVGIDMFPPGILKFRLEMDMAFLDDFARVFWHYLAQDPELENIEEDVPFKPGKVTYHISLGYLMEVLSESEIDILVKAMADSFDEEKNIFYDQPIGSLNGFSDMNTFFYKTGDLYDVEGNDLEPFLSQDSSIRQALSRIKVLATDVGGTLKDGNPEHLAEAINGLRRVLQSDLPVRIVSMGGLQGILNDILSKLDINLRKNVEIFWGGGIIKTIIEVMATLLM